MTPVSRLMANVERPTASKRRLLMIVTHSVLFYGSEIWADVLRQEKYKKWMASAQRQRAERMTSSYRTVSKRAVLVIAGVTLIDCVWERRFRYEIPQIIYFCLYINKCIYRIDYLYLMILIKSIVFNIFIYWCNCFVSISSSFSFVLTRVYFIGSLYNVNNNA